ncbi:hypothetical protein ST47_g572 [Ascochyta rabiei]|uniref:Uncharacterized protein n=1 Tax=Didymella rabiei TaxID=5454 RepID=A0A163M097_DIDRA|nr:hypothetical protein ST47_g572 [Ascochyta rabiei]
MPPSPPSPHPESQYFSLNPQRCFFPLRTTSSISQDLRLGPTNSACTCLHFCKYTAPNTEAEFERKSLSVASHSATLASQTILACCQAAFSSACTDGSALTQYHTHPVQMAINWKESDAKDRLLAAVIAASTHLNMNEVARLFGQGATYDAVECQLRKVKKLAAKLKVEAAGRPSAAVVPSRSKYKTIESPAKTPVKTGRVAKAMKATDRKTKVKLELLEDEVDAVLDSTASEELEESV